MGIFNNKPVTDEPIDLESLDADKNEEAAEKLSEESTDLAAELAADASGTNELFQEMGQSDSDEAIVNSEKPDMTETNKEIKDFEDAFGEGASPLTVLVNLASRVRELEKKVF